MTRHDREKWDLKYICYESIHGRKPCYLLAGNIGLLPRSRRGKRALDVACGEGRNAIFLAHLGYRVDAIDISEVGLIKAYKFAREKGVGDRIHFIQADLEEHWIMPRTYDIICNFYYLDRELIPQLKSGLKANGIIFFETLTVRQREVADETINPAYLLKERELMNAFQDFEILLYIEGTLDSPDGGKKAVASLIGRKEEL